MSDELVERLKELSTRLIHVISEVRGEAPRLVVRSDAYHWRNKGVPAACFGPQPSLSAGVDDYANERDVADCAKIYALAAIDLMCLRRGASSATSPCLSAPVK
ncbi:hypothetical protein [Bradyrhizobium pachyrhizi]|uniref:hypothetical protein n=1 Tax=Bradyrhizobium pachyrhizi TaxID=280333 RepID=UPI003D36AFE5